MTRTLRRVSVRSQYRRGANTDEKNDGTSAEPAHPSDLFTALFERIAELGGVDLDLPARDTPPRAPDLDA